MVLMYFLFLVVWGECSKPDPDMQQLLRLVQSMLDYTLPETLDTRGLRHRSRKRNSRSDHQGCVF